MEYFLYFIGFVAGVAIFMYLFSMFQEGKERLQKRSSAAPGHKKGIQPEQQPQPQQQAYTYPRERICPLCGARLSKYEALYASQVKDGESRRILIYGCRYCYRPDENSDQKRTTDIFGE